MFVFNYGTNANFMTKKQPKDQDQDSGVQDQDATATCLGPM